MDKPKKYRAVDMITGEMICGWYVEIYLQVMDTHDRLIGYTIKHCIFNDEPGRRSYGSYWHEIDPETLREL